MKTACPTCGAEVEFRFDDSFVRVCAHCRGAVLRTDRGLESLGKVADLVPFDSPLRLFAEGRVGSSTFLLVGMAQLRHAAGGLWQEWYARFDGGRWGWLAEAQGRYYLTFEEPASALPPLEALEPGVTCTLTYRGAPREFTVGERGEATYVAATGELPYRLPPGGAFRFADLADGEGAFATIDYGDAGDAGAQPTIHLGHQVDLASLRLTGGEAPTTAAPRAASRRLACPQCDAPVELRAPGESQRVVCESCNTLLDASEGPLAVLGALASRARPPVPLGTRGTFAEGPMTVIGYLQRSAKIEARWYPFHELLLHAPGLGFRWLVQSDGHWSYVRPITPGAVQVRTKTAAYDGVSFRRFAVAPLRVDQVLGEFFWRVQAGEQALGEDWIAPPAMLTRESADHEESWSLSTYLTEEEVRRAFGEARLDLRAPMGIGANQPNRAARATSILTAGALALGVAGALAWASAAKRLVLTQPLTLGPSRVAVAATPTPAPAPSTPGACGELRGALAGLAACAAVPVDERDRLAGAWRSAAEAGDSPTTCRAGALAVRSVLRAYCPGGATAAPAAPAAPAPVDGAEPAANVTFSAPFGLLAGENVEITLDAPGLSNDWAYLSLDLVEEATGKVVSLDGGMEYYAGYEDGEAWSEGAHRTRIYVGPQPTGRYVLRFEGQHGSEGNLDVIATIRQGVFRAPPLALALGALFLPLAIIGLVSRSREKRRWENATEDQPTTLGSAIWAVLALLLVGLVALLGKRGSDD